MFRCRFARSGHALAGKQQAGDPDTVVREGQRQAGVAMVGQLGRTVSASTQVGLLALDDAA